MIENFNQKKRCHMKLLAAFSMVGTIGMAFTGKPAPLSLMKSRLPNLLDQEVEQT